MHLIVADEADIVEPGLVTGSVESIKYELDQSNDLFEFLQFKDEKRDTYIDGDYIVELVIIGMNRGFRNDYEARLESEPMYIFFS